MQSQKWQNDLCLFPRQTIKYHRNPSLSSVFARRIPGMGEPGGLPSVGSHRVGHDWTTELNWTDEDLQDLVELTPKKDVLFITGDWNAKAGSQEISRVMGKFGHEWRRAKANRVIPREYTGHRKYPLATKQENTLHITRWSILKSDWLYSLWPKMEKLL